MKCAGMPVLTLFGADNFVTSFKRVGNKVSADAATYWIYVSNYVIHLVQEVEKRVSPHGCGHEGTTAHIHVFR